MNKWLRPLLAVLVLTGCSKPSPKQEALTRPAHSERGSPAPAAPIELSFQAPMQAPAGRALNIDAAITTPVKSGSLVVKVAAQQGVTLLADPFQRIDLGSAEQPLPVTVELLPGSGRQRYVVLVVTIETDSALPLSRSFRIALPDDDGAAESPSAPATDGMKMLPATPVR